MPFDPSGGVQSFEVAYCPPGIGIGMGTVVKVAPGAYARVLAAQQMFRNGQWRMFLRLEPIPTGTVLTGWGEYAPDDVRSIDDLMTPIAGD